MNAECIRLICMHIQKASSGDYDRLVRVSIVMIDKCNKIYDKPLYEKV